MEVSFELYGKMHEFSTIYEAVSFLLGCMTACDPSSSEYSRYAHTLQQVLVLEKEAQA